MKRFFIVGISAIILLCLAVWSVENWREKIINFLDRFGPRATVEQRLAQYGAEARLRMVPRFRSAMVDYPPRSLTWLAIKKEKILEVYAGKGLGDLRFVHRYPVFGASGFLGPKLKEGDRQVPEGVYRIMFLNPNSRFHLSLRLNYPNPFDLEMARREGRTRLGGDIMIHGDSASTGCLAMGNKAIEELFVLAADAGTANIRVVIVPVDFRKEKRLPAGHAVSPAWVNGLYSRLISLTTSLPVGK